MPKIKLMRIVMIVGSVLILAGVSIMWGAMVIEEEQNVIEVELDNEETQSIEFEGLGLIPGGECEYTIKLEDSGSDKYDLTLNFVETEEKTLKNFARAKIIANCEVVCDELLATIFEKEDIILPVDFKENINTELRIVYYLPIEVGNEAKNAEATFELLLTASNE